MEKLEEKSPEKNGAPEKKTLKEQGFYKTGNWQRARKLALQRDNYLCQMQASKKCTKIATEVHHLKPLEEFPELGLELSNLVSVCRQCHELTKVRPRRRWRPKAAKPEPPAGARVIKI